jgi:hypothetical protein
VRRDDEVIGYIAQLLGVAGKRAAHQSPGSR